MSEEKKNAVTEEVKEVRKLTEEELAQVSGGEMGTLIVGATVAVAVALEEKCI